MRRQYPTRPMFGSLASESAFRKPVEVGMSIKKDFSLQGSRMWRVSVVQAVNSALPLEYSVSIA